jgi:hypothetical protein
MNKPGKNPANQKLRTNLAAEFYVLSMLYRLGVPAHLTLGNEKAVDIVAEKDGKLLKIDVKGIAKKNPFLLGNRDKGLLPDYYVLVSFEGKIDDPAALPVVYIVPAKDIDKSQSGLGGKALLSRNGMCINYRDIETLSAKYQDKWEVFTDQV